MLWILLKDMTGEIYLHTQRNNCTEVCYGSRRWELAGRISVIYFFFSVIYIALRLSVLAPFGSFNLSEVNAPFRRAGSADSF